MDCRERFLAGLSAETPDRPPVAHVAALTTIELQESTGCGLPDAHHDPAGQARLLAANHHVLGFDAVTFIINFFGEPAALGASMDWGTSTRLPTFTSNPWRRVEDAVIPRDLLDRAPIRTYLETLRIAKRDYGREMAVLGKVMGPFSMVQAMHGVENVMLALIDEPQRIRAFLDVCVDVLVRCGNAQFELGIDALAIGEGGAGAQMLSPAMYRQFLLPVHQQMIRRLRGPTVMHICGDVRPRLQMLAETGLTCFNFDWSIPPQTMAEAAAGKFTVMGNVSTTDLLNADPAEIERQVQEAVKAGVHIISPGCAVSPKCPNANLRAMADAVAGDGR